MEVFTDSDAYIHIGTHKTGSTSIQNFLLSNDLLLKEQGFSTLHYDGNFHIPAYFLGFGGPEVLRENFSRYSLTDIEKVLCNIISGATGKLILSSEVFFENPNEKNLSMLKEFLRPLQARVIVYVRRQDDYTISAYKEVVRHPFFNSNVLSNLEYADWYQRLEVFADVFGKVNIIVRPFEKRQFYKEELIADFCHALNISLDANFDYSNYNENISQPDSITELLRLVNHHFTSREQIQEFEEYLCKIGGLAPLFKVYNYISYEERLRIFERFFDSNKALAIEYLKRKDGRLFDTPNKVLLPATDYEYDKENTINSELAELVYSGYRYSLKMQPD